MSALVTFPRVSLQAALEAHLASLGTLDTETLRYPNAPSVTTVEPLCEAARAAEEERAELVGLLEDVEWEGPGDYARRCPLCFQEKREGHAPDCALHAALVAAGRRGP